jgi:hypothetical protein
MPLSLIERFGHGFDVVQIEGVTLWTNGVIGMAPLPSSAVSSLVAKSELAAEGLLKEKRPKGSGHGL